MTFYSISVALGHQHLATPCVGRPHRMPNLGSMVAVCGGAGNVQRHVSEVMLYAARMRWGGVLDKGPAYRGHPSYLAGVVLVFC
jgi:hypothetical protein